MTIDGESVKFADYINSLDNGINSVEEFAKALADTNGALFEFSEELSNIPGAASLSDLEYEYAKSSKTSTDTQEYEDQLKKLTEAAAEAYDIDFEDITAQAKAFREELSLTEGAARDLAIQNQRMTKGIDSLYDG
jgi:chromosome segregation ATPase